MKRNFFIGTTLLNVVCVNVNNALCDCCSVCKEKKFIAKALGIKESDIWFIKKFKGIDPKNEIDTFFDKQGDDFKKKGDNSHIVVLYVCNVGDSGKPKEDDACAFCALIDKEKNINPSGELLDIVSDKNDFLIQNKGKKVKIIVVNKYGEDDETIYSCKKN